MGRPSFTTSFMSKAVHCLLRTTRRPPPCPSSKSSYSVLVSVVTCFPGFEASNWLSTESDKVDDEQVTSRFPSSLQVSPLSWIDLKQENR